MWTMNKKMLVSGLLLTAAVVGQIALAFFLYDPDASALRINLGWLVLMVSGVFGWLPIFSFRRKGKPSGKSYTSTTVLVDSGVYRIVRHPQYLAGVLISIGLPLITLHWTVIVLGIIAIAINYQSTFDEEQNCLEKFGEDYTRYMERVPRLNFMLGLIRLLRQKK
jgi:protein-S-isoprenylcysteine O-methyltransferase Ste14